MASNGGMVVEDSRQVMSTNLKSIIIAVFIEATSRRFLLIIILLFVIVVLLLEVAVLDYASLALASTYATCDAIVIVW